MWYPSCCLGNVSVSVIISQNVPWILNISFIVGVVLTVLQCWWPPPHADLEGLVSQRPAKRAVPWGVGRRPHKNKASSPDWAASCSACVGRVSSGGGGSVRGLGGCSRATWSAPLWTSLIQQLRARKSCRWHRVAIRAPAALSPLSPCPLDPCPLDPCGTPACSAHTNLPEGL